MSHSFPSSLALVGAGKMGGAMLEGWLALGLQPQCVRVFDPQPAPALAEFARDRGFLLNPPMADAGPPQVLVLAIKPQMLDAAAPQIAPLVDESTLVVSILAGKTIADIAGRLPAARAIVRAMPNTPAAVGRGIAGLAANAGVSAGQRAIAQSLLAAIGQAIWLDSEAQIDMVTAVSGSGPAYVFYLTECLAAAGVEAGLPAALAAQLARATVEGSGELMFRDAAIAPAELRRNVTSPGGTTAAALEILMAEDGLEPLMRRTVLAALRRARELAG